MKRYFPASFLICLFLTTLALSQTPTPTATPKTDVLTDDDVIKVESRLIVVPVSVTDAAGQPVLGLGAKDFEITEENSRQEIAQVSTAEKVPLEIAILFDVSASTDAMFQFQQETAAQFLREVMRPEDRATIFTVGAQPILVQGRNPSENASLAVQSIKPTKEQTAFYDSVSVAADYLSKNAVQGSRRVLIVISDGEDTNSKAVINAIWNAERKLVNSVDGKTLREIRVKARDDAKGREMVRVARSLQNADAVFYSINPAGSSFQLNQMSQFGQSNMQRFADETGGTAFLPKFSPIDLKDQLQNSSNSKRNREILTRIFKQLASELQAQYLLQYYSESEFPTNKFVRLAVGLKNPARLKVRARQGYYVKN
jgi:VWFA-related protein